MRIQSLGRPTVPQRATTPQPCSEDTREQIVDLLHQSVELQEAAKFGAGVSLGGGALLGVATSGLHPALGIALGVAVGAAGLGAAVYGWHKSGDLLERAVQLNEQSACFTREELIRIYESIP